VCTARHKTSSKIPMFIIKVSTVLKTSNLIIQSTKVKLYSTIYLKRNTQSNKQLALVNVETLAPPGVAFN